MFEAEAYEEVVERLHSAVDPERRRAAEELYRRHEGGPGTEGWPDEHEVDWSDEDEVIWFEGEVAATCERDEPFEEAEVIERDSEPMSDASSATQVWDRADHWIGGHITGVQGHPPQEHTTLLLHLAWDEDLGFRFQDGGAVQFRIPTAALETRDWSRAFAEGDSC